MSIFYSNKTYEAKRYSGVAGFALKYYVWLVAVSFLPMMAWGQQNININMAPIDGLSLTPDNIFNYHVQASRAGNVVIKGTIRYRNSNLNLSYSFNYLLRQGINMLSQDMIHPHWQFSSPALQELFFTYKVLPSGTFEYCVNITPVNVPQENGGNTFDECLYHRSDDFFLVNLIDPADKAKLTEFNPMLTWVANYSFSGELTYRIRVAEMKQGQNPVNAVMRNQPIYDDKNLVQNSTIYPLFAKPLVANQPYAWTVDAYYKGILLGGAETWQFIIPDTIPQVVKANRAYIDVKRETGLNRLTALGSLKLKYILDDKQKDVLSLELINEQGNKCQLKPDKLNAVYGDNRYVLDLAESANLKHQGMYTLKVTTTAGQQYKLSFQYLNPAFQH